MQDIRVSHWCRAVLVVWLPMAGCVARTPLYPHVDAAEPSSILVIDNQSDRHPTVALAIGIQVDGVSVGRPSTPAWLAGEIAMPVGVTTLRIPAGSHELTTRGLKGDSPYYYDPVRVRFDTQAGQTYTLRLRKGAGRFWQPGYFIQYEGWPDDLRAQWAAESLIANPLF